MKIPKWWMVTAEGERLCWVPAPTAEVALEVFKATHPTDADRVASTQAVNDRHSIA